MCIRDRAEMGSASKAFLYAGKTSDEEAIPHALLCLIIPKVVSSNSLINLIAESTSNKLLYESSLPFNFLKISFKSPLNSPF